MSTDKDTRILAYLRRHPRASYREIAAACGLSSTSVASYQVSRLVERGLVRRGPYHHARALMVVGVDPLREAAALLLERAERQGGAAVVPWVAIEALRKAL